MPQSKKYVSLNAVRVARAFHFFIFLNQQKCDIGKDLIVCSPSALNITVVDFIN